ncbi:uroporphyrinogen decarboxylase family protein [Maribellus mangrovi]|uniref:uroporphyrinogen decarboxylase family protein n=1 Tax=Maribellus mangrovi TaxID=3133146 RepID=UPI0030EF5BFC
MNHKERFLATIANAPVDRPASWMGLPVPSAMPNLTKYFGVSTFDEVKTLLDDDIYPIEVPYNYAPSNHIACAFDFAKRDHLDKPDDRTLTAPGFFEDYDDPADVDKFNWPDPAKYLDREEANRRVKAAGNDYAKMGIMWSAHFQDSCSAFGMETALITMLMNPDMYQAVLKKITDFYLKANEIFYEATKGELDAVLFGDDFGSQTGLMLDPDLIRQYIFPGTKLLIEQAKSYGLKVMYHSCGSIFPIIDDIFRLGADIVHPLQAKATGMSVENIHANFAGKGAFCGGIDAQYLMVEGSPEDVKKRVNEVIDLFPTGLIVSPSHEAVLPDIPPANIEALFKTVARRK